MLAISVQVFASHPVAAAQYSKWLAAEHDFSLVKGSCVDVAIFDGELSCLEVTLTLARIRYPSMRSVLLSRFLDVDECLRWMLRGIRGMVAYDRYEKDLTSAVRAVARGQMYFSSQVLNRWKQLDRRLRVAAQGAPLTRRESEIARLLSRRLSNKQVAAILGLSERTVKYHVGHVLTKLGLESRYELLTTSTALSDSGGADGRIALLSGIHQS